MELQFQKELLLLCQLVHYTAVHSIGRTLKRLILKGYTETFIEYEVIDTLKLDRIY